jgi:trans-aconitate 2-methyltransferase
MAWDPSQYLKFAGERLRPGFDLLARIGDLPAGPVWDLGCGTGEHARAMAERWPERPFHGVDLSAEMLAKAAARPSRVEWSRGPVETWSPPQPVALVFSNAVLQWLDDHPRLLPKLVQALAPGGVLAIQMPRNFDQPSHVLMRAVASEGRWAERLDPMLRRDPVASPQTYYALLQPVARAGLDIWETEYLHALEETSSGESPVLSWVRATALRPLLEALDAGQQREFVAAYDARLRQAYPAAPDGRTLFPFRRLFIVART